MSREKGQNINTVSGIQKDADYTGRTPPGRWVLLNDISSLDWNQVNHLRIQKMGQDGCYVDHGQVTLVGSGEAQIRNCISMCGNNLHILDLSYSTIREIPKEIRNLKSLRYLGLRGLRLGHLPNWLPEIAEAFTIDPTATKGKDKAIVSLWNTTVEAIDMSIFEQPYEVVVRWFEERKGRNLVPLNEIKVVFLGDGEAGKTHTIARLLNDGGDLNAEYFDAKSTPGIVIRDKIYELDGNNVKVHFWDFGGQEILHSMHRMFLTERTLYVVLLNARDDTQDDRARYWLHTIRSFAGNSPVLLVLNKIDQNPNAAINEPALRDIYSGLRRVVRLSALEFNREMFNKAFTDALLDEIRQFDSLGTLWPASWAKLKTGLENVESNYITGVDYKQMCADSGVEKNQRELLQWFNDLGIGFSYSGSSRLEDYMLAKPEWITNAIYVLLFNKSGATRNGVLPMRIIYEMLDPHDENAYRRVRSDFRYDINEADYVLEVMRKFRLSYAVSNEEEFIPALCQRESMPVAKEYANDPNALEFRMSYDYLPDNVIHRLMVEMRSDLQLSDVWRTGALFCQPGTGLSAVVNSEGDLLRIFVRSENELHRPNTYLCILKENIDRINRDLKLPPPFAEVVYKTERGNECFDYHDLLIALEEGETTYRSKKLRRAISIQDILNQSGRAAELELERLRDDILTACIHLQGNRMLWNTTVDEANTFIRDILRNKGYYVVDQTIQGVGRGGMEHGDLNLEIRREANIPWTIMETLRIKDGAKTDWNRHLNKLLDNYNPSGMHHLFLLTYVDCDKDDFERILRGFSEHIRWHDEGKYVRLPNTFTHVPLRRHGDPAYLRVMRCTYDRSGSPTTVCHIFVRMQLMHSNVFRNSGSKLPSGEQKTNKSAPLQPAQPILQEYRVVFLGDSEAGKSLIMHRIKYPEKAASSFISRTTAGIDIFRREETINNRPVRVNYWDFGGQEILHAMHRIFLAENTLYVIVLNTRNDNQDAQAYFWMRYVEAYAPGAPVLLVMNKMDQNERAALNLPALRRVFNRKFASEDVLKISAMAEKDVFGREFAEKLRACIGRFLSEMEDFTDQQSRIRDKVEKKKAVEKIISIDEFIDICKKEGLCDEDEQRYLMNRFNDTGIVVHFKGKTLMFMNPEWITKTLYRILEEGGKNANNGIILHSELQSLCRNNPAKWRGSEDANYLVEIMRDYDFSFQYERLDPKEKGSGDKEFIPVLCRREEPDTVEEQIACSNILEMQIHFSYLPSDVLYQLMVRYKKDLDADMVWASGAKFTFGSANYAFVRRDGNMLSIFAHYPEEGTRHNTVQYMYKLKSAVEEIVSERQSTAKIQQIKLGYMIGRKMEYFDLKQLENAQACGVYYTASTGAEARKIAVRDILDQQDRSTERKTDKLLMDLEVACTQLQQSAPFMDDHEDIRNSYLVAALKNMQYDVTDQTLVGKANSGKRQNELDILIRFPNREPWIIIEALVVTPKKGLSVWNNHLDKLVGRYNASWGLRKLVLISYVDCPEPDFAKLYKKYRDHMRIYSPKDARIQESSFDECPELSQKEYLKVDRCAYSQSENSVMVYHYFVRMDANEIMPNQVDSQVS